MERALRTHSSSALTSHAAQEAVLTLFVSLIGLSASASALFIQRNPHLYYGAVLVAGLLFAVAFSMLLRWFRKYGRRRSRHGNLARGQVPALFAFLGLLLQLGIFVALFVLSTIRWRGF